MNQLDVLKRHFNQGKSLTVLSAINRYGVYALSQRVGQLKKKPHKMKIESKLIALPNGKHIARYRKAS